MSPKQAAPPRRVCRIPRLALALIVGWFVAVSGCATLPHQDIDSYLKPSNHRDWRASMAIPPYAKIRGDDVAVYNIRNCSYLDENTYVLDYYDHKFDLRDIKSVDFIVVPFKDVPSLAHTMLSFGFRDGRHLAASVEVRLEEGETYSPIGGALHEFELMYVLADERDVIRLRTEQYDADVYIYPTVATPQQARDLFLDVLRRVNSLKKHPEFYDTIVNNCTTNIVSHINRLNPGRIPWNPTNLLTGYSDWYAYQLGLLVDYGSFDATRRHAHVTTRTDRPADSVQFSQRIRSSDTDSIQ